MTIIIFGDDKGDLHTCRHFVGRVASKQPWYPVLWARYLLMKPLTKCFSVSGVRQRIATGIRLSVPYISQVSSAWVSSGEGHIEARSSVCTDSTVQYQRHPTVPQPPHAVAIPFAQAASRPCSVAVALLSSWQSAIFVSPQSCTDPGCRQIVRYSTKQYDHQKFQGTPASAFPAMSLYFPPRFRIPSLLCSKLGSTKM